MIGLPQARTSVVVGASLSRGLPPERERIGFDTNVFIYFLEYHPRYGAGNDRGLRRVKEIECLIVDEII